MTHRCLEITATLNWTMQLVYFRRTNKQTIEEYIFNDVTVEEDWLFVMSLPHAQNITKQFTKLELPAHN